MAEFNGWAQSATEEDINNLIENDKVNALLDAVYTIHKSVMLIKARQDLLIQAMRHILEKIGDEQAF